MVDRDLDRVDRRVAAVYADDPSAFGDASHQVGDVLVRQATAAIRYLELLHSERQRGAVQGQIAETLQRSLLPTIPELSG